MGMHDDVRKVELPICGRNAWRVGEEGFVVEWNRKDGAHTAYVWENRGDYALIRAVGAGLDAESAVAAVHRAWREGQ
jgi:hypothetical protein